MSRPKKHYNNAAKQRAYRERKKRLREMERDPKHLKNIQDAERVKRVLGW